VEGNTTKIIHWHSRSRTSLRTFESQDFCQVPIHGSEAALDPVFTGYSSLSIHDPTAMPTHSRVSPPQCRSQHQFLPARFHSSYSELSANIAFMSETKPQPSSSSQAPKSSKPSEMEPSTPTGTPLSKPRYDRRRSSTPVDPSSAPIRLGSQPRLITRGKTLTSDESFPPTTHVTALRPLVPVKKAGNDGRKQPSLACFFCRERKIACGRPAEGSKDRTCNQCVRRSLPCDYPTESMRGQHKRRKVQHDRNPNVGVPI